jgi:hypothetical protein
MLLVEEDDASVLDVDSAFVLGVDSRWESNDEQYFSPLYNTLL